VDRPIMSQRWERLTFLHWPFDPADVQRLIPDWLQVETYDGAAWVGLVPFFMRVGTAGGRYAPWASTFCETNVRTYATDRGGRSGIWFFSLDAARFGAVVAARTTYRLPYFWSTMGLTEDGDEIRYHTRRRWPGPRGASSRVRVQVHDAMAPSEVGQRDHFLTARWVLFSSTPRSARFARACHQPWPLRRATAVEVDDGLLTAAGLPPPEGEPLVHYSPGVEVRIGRPEPVVRSR
jgi:uncharacterized protein YqjF (DUF2071 family)